MGDGAAELVLAQARVGRAGALEAIYRELHPHVLAYLRVHARDAAEDLAADTFVSLAAALPKFSGDWDGMRGLVFTIARRRAQDHIRRSTRRRTDATDVAEIPLPSSRDASGGAFDRLGEEEARRLVAGLPPDQAQVILLRVLGDLSVERTAEILGKRPGAVRALQLRALRRLARELGGQT
jgi:RNA polymerase sigma-70 factor (ECF subfamily)